MSRLLGSGGVPALYSDAEWADCRAGIALKQYTDSIEKNIATGRGLLLVGPIGTGKSSAAALVAKSVVMAGKTVRWCYVPDLLAELRDNAQARQLVKLSSAADLLIWDDFGVAGLAEWQIGLLDRIVEKRYQNGKPMVVTTNMSKISLSDPSLSRLNDRWSERRYVVTISGESMRKTWRDQNE